MGFILSKFRKKKSTYEVLEHLEAEITRISQFQASTVVWQKKVVGHLVTYSIVVYLLLALLVYFQFLPSAITRHDQFLLLLPFLVFPFLVWGVRKLLTWWYRRKVTRDDKKLRQLKEKKTKILDEVMEKETYKVAKQILDKFGQNQAGLRVGSGLAPIGSRPSGISLSSSASPPDQIRRRPVPSLQSSSQPPAPSQQPATQSRSGLSNVSNISSSSPARPLSAPGPVSAQPQKTPSGTAPVPIIPQPRPPGLGGGRSAPGPPLPRPVLPRDRGYMDKFVEFLVGDGPANRYALICRQCQSHNGMALREEFEYIAYRCCYCYYWNPARKQRPVAPRLPEQSAVSTAASDSSSGSDISAPPSTNQSRRSSVVDQCDITEEKEIKVTDSTVATDENIVDEKMGDELAQDSADLVVINKEDIVETNVEKLTEQDQMTERDRELNNEKTDENITEDTAMDTD